MNDPEQKLRLAIDLAPHVPADRLPDTCARIWEWANGGRVEIKLVEPEGSDIAATIHDDGPPRAVAENPFAKPVVKPKPATPDQELLARCRAEPAPEEPAPLKPIVKTETPKPKRAVVRGRGKNALLTPERRRALFMDMARKVKSMGQLEYEYGLSESQIKSQRATYLAAFKDCERAVNTEMAGRITDARQAHAAKDATSPPTPNQGGDLVDMPSFVATPKRPRLPVNTSSMDGAIPARQSGDLTDDERFQIENATVRRFEGGTFDDILRRTLENAGRDVGVRWAKREYRWVIDGKEMSIQQAAAIANEYRRAAGAEPLTPPPGPSGRKPLPTAMPSQSELKAQARAAHAAKAGGGA